MLLDSAQVPPPQRVIRPQRSRPRGKDHNVRAPEQEAPLLVCDLTHPRKGPHDPNTSESEGATVTTHPPAPQAHRVSH